MFSSNQRFIVTGETEKQLEAVLKCISVYTGLKIEAISYEPDGVMVLWDYGIFNNSADIIKIPKEEEGNFEYLLCYIKQYLCSKRYDKLLKDTFNEWNNWDGSSHKGWEIGYYGELNKGDDWGRSVYIRPYWNYYSK